MHMCPIVAWSKHSVDAACFWRKFIFFMGGGMISKEFNTFQAKKRRYLQHYSWNALLKSTCPPFSRKSLEISTTVPWKEFYVVITVSSFAGYPVYYLDPLISPHLLIILGEEQQQPAIDNNFYNNTLDWLASSSFLSNLRFF